MVRALRIKEPLSLENVYLYLTEAVEWMWIDVDLQIFSLNLLILVIADRDHIQVVRIGVLEVYRLLSPTALLSCKVEMDEEKDNVT